MATPPPNQAAKLAALAQLEEQQQPASDSTYKAMYERVKRELEELREKQQVQVVNLADLAGFTSEVDAVPQWKRCRTYSGNPGVARSVAGSVVSSCPAQALYQVPGSRGPAYLPSSAPKNAFCVCQVGAPQPGGLHDEPCLANL